MAMAGRSWSASDYRYGYQGSEINQETHNNSNQYTTEFRQLDPRFGRWFSADPVFQPWQSPYNSMDGNPLCLNDVNGLDPGKGSINEEGDEYTATSDDQAYTIWNLHARKSGMSQERFCNLNDGVDYDEEKGMIHVDGGILPGQVVVIRDPDAQLTEELNVKEKNIQKPTPQLPVPAEKSVELKNEQNQSNPEGILVLNGTDNDDGILSAAAIDKKVEGSGVAGKYKAGAKWVFAEGVNNSIAGDDGLALDLAVATGVFSGSAEGELGHHAYNLYGKTSAKFLEADAKANVGFYAGGENKAGFKAEAEAGAYFAQADLTGGFELFGFKLKGTVGGSFASAHIGAKGNVCSDNIERELNVEGMVHLGLGLGLKLGLDFSFDWGYYEDLIGY